MFVEEFDLNWSSSGRLVSLALMILWIFLVRHFSSYFPSFKIKREGKIALPSYFLLFLGALFIVYIGLQAAGMWIFLKIGTVFFDRNLLFVSMIALAVFGVLFLFALYPSRIKNIVIGSKNFKYFFKGVRGIFVVFPYAMLMAQMTEMIRLFFWKEPLHEQLAVQGIKNLITSPFLFFLGFIFVVVFIPLVEELLFRGFLQNYLKSRYGSFGAVIVGSLIFAAFHYSPVQGLENGALFMGLFTFSCFAGALYESERSLLVSWGLHAAFNFISIIVLLIQSL